MVCHETCRDEKGMVLSEEAEKLVRHAVKRSDRSKVFIGPKSQVKPKNTIDQDYDQQKEHAYVFILSVGLVKDIQWSDTEQFSTIFAKNLDPQLYNFN